MSIEDFFFPKSLTSALGRVVCSLKVIGNEKILSEEEIYWLCGYPECLELEFSVVTESKERCLFIFLQIRKTMPIQGDFFTFQLTQKTQCFQWLISGLRFSVVIHGMFNRSDLLPVCKSRHLIIIFFFSHINLFPSYASPANLDKVKI